MNNAIRTRPLIELTPARPCPQCQQPLHPARKTCVCGWAAPAREDELLDPVLSAPEAAKVLGVSYRVFRRQRWGELIPKLPGWKYAHYRQSAVERFKTVLDRVAS
jgi:hypothetical protein